MKIKTEIKKTGNLEAYTEDGEFIGLYNNKSELIEIFESEHGFVPELI